MQGSELRRAADKPHLQGTDFCNRIGYFKGRPYLYQVWFWNLEYSFGAVQELKEILIYPALGIAIILVFVLSALVNDPESWGIMVLLLGASFFAYLYWVDKPRRVVRCIELNFKEETVRVFRNQKEEITEAFPLHADLRFTEERHPGADYRAQVRQENAAKGIKTGQRLSKEERSQCLFGLFGATGAKKVLLVTRAVWGPGLDNTIYEVHRAIDYAIYLGAGGR